MPKPVFEMDKRVMDRLIREIKAGKCENFVGVYEDGELKQLKMIEENIEEIERIYDDDDRDRIKAWDIHTFKNGEQIRVKTPNYMMWLMADFPIDD